MEVQFILDLADCFARMTSHPRFLADFRCRSVVTQIGDEPSAYIARSLKRIASIFEEAERHLGVTGRPWSKVVLTEQERIAVVAAVRSTLELRYQSDVFRTAQYNRDLGGCMGVELADLELEIQKDEARRCALYDQAVLLNRDAATARAAELER